MFKSYGKAISNYANFKGSESRKSFWCYILQFAGLSIAAGTVDDLSGTGIIVSTGFTLFMLLPHMAIVARRLHDSGLSGWWQILSLIPIAGGILVLILCLRRHRMDSPYHLEGDRYMSTLSGDYGSVANGPAH
ncbi:DUF805 domain-containing protein [Marinobacter halodurans]|uniref:DUF805 domain-containing protein n=1 Tax=Marinobacter halodurans TaxID=2528979 RepID=A0ABY1ZMC7_9GAMM|nr:DUF805 domain-containing protein [Marinobacter halodurans]TBW57460.1 DUF805 domain-containing protein [Marinobacter halodurans]